MTLNNNVRIVKYSLMVEELIVKDNLSKGESTSVDRIKELINSLCDEEFIIRTDFQDEEV